MSMSEGVQRDLNFIRTTGRVIEFDVSTGHSYLANLLKTGEWWTLILNARDRGLTISVLKALPHYQKDDGHSVFQPCDDLLFLIMLLRKSAVDITAILAALSPLFGCRAERRRTAKEVARGKDIIGIGGGPATGLAMLGSSTCWTAHPPLTE
jgi:hypothetical protein